MKNSIALWIIAVALMGIMLVILSCAGLFVAASYYEYQRREDLLEREPWRRFEREPYKYAP